MERDPVGWNKVCGDKDKPCNRDKGQSMQNLKYQTTSDSIQRA